MTRLVLTILILSTFVVAGILFSPKQKQQVSQQPDSWPEKTFQAQPHQPTKLIEP
ncbi:MAG: hypothetical protein MI867_00845 [Pseudomonadales bacterium]|nr:hypothetical protein [Pseudomonadales bacterium]